MNGVVLEKNHAGNLTAITFKWSEWGPKNLEFFDSQNIDLPVDYKPNAKTKTAIREAKNYKKLKSYTSSEDLLSDCFN